MKMGFGRFKAASCGSESRTERRTDYITNVKQQVPLVNRLVGMTFPAVARGRGPR